MMKIKLVCAMAVRAKIKPRLVVKGETVEDQTVLVARCVGQPTRMNAVDSLDVRGQATIQVAVEMVLRTVQKTA